MSQKIHSQHSSHGDPFKTCQVLAVPFSNNARVTVRPSSALATSPHVPEKKHGLVGDMCFSRCPAQRGPRGSVPSPPDSRNEHAGQMELSLEQFGLHSKSQPSPMNRHYFCKSKKRLKAGGHFPRAGLQPASCCLPKPSSGWGVSPFPMHFKCQGPPVPLHLLSCFSCSPALLSPADLESLRWIVGGGGGVRKTEWASL